jgi:F420-non-reducing hydrogenase iron-sulfur subunit
MRLNYPTNVKIVKVPCTGRVDIIHVLKALESGADGVFLAGCLEGECHFLKGNLRAKKRVAYLKELLTECGIGGDRVAMYNLSSAQGQRFAEIAREMTEKVKALGPNPVQRSKHNVQDLALKFDEKTEKEASP